MTGLATAWVGTVAAVEIAVVGFYAAHAAWEDRFGIAFGAMFLVGTPLFALTVPAAMLLQRRRPVLAILLASIAPLAVGLLQCDS